MRNKILIVTSEFPPHPGGIGNHALNLAQQLVKNNFNVTVIAPRNNMIEDSAFDSSENFKILRYPLSRFVKFFAIGTLIFISTLKSRKNILIATGQSSLLCTSIFPKLLFKKSIAIFHGSELRVGSKIIINFLKISISKFDKIVAVSRFSKNCLLGAKSHLKAIVINNGFDPNRLSRNREKTTPSLNSVKLITLGSLSYRKGQHNVINSLPHLKKKYGTVFYEMIGKPYIKSDLIELATKLGVENSVKFHGYLSIDDVVEKLLSSDIFVMLSENIENGGVEGFGIAILEANYLGLPAIGSLGCGIEDAISNGYNGKLISNDSPADLYLATRNIIENYKNYSKNSIRWAKERTWELVVEKYKNEIS